MTPPARSAIVCALADEASRVRAAIDTKRSDNLLRLFDFLLERSIAGKPARESEIAGAIFAQSYHPAQGATARVYIHRLRKRLDQYYAERTGPRLHIPLGDYCLTLIDPAATAAPENEGTDPPARPSRRLRGWAIPAVVAGMLLANGAVALHPLLQRERPQAPIVQTMLWSPLARSARGDIVVVGDHYLFAELDDRKNIAQIIRDPRINSREDLDVYLMGHRQELGTLRDLDLHHLPAAVLVALQDIWPVVQTLSGSADRLPALVSASQLNPDNLKSSDIVYVGTLGALNAMMRNPLFQASGFRIGNSYNELIDQHSGQRFASDGSVLADDRTPRKDYGYIARLPGPAGNQVVFVSGLRDPAVRQMAEIARDPARLKLLADRLGGHDGAFEALFQVRTLGAVGLDSKLLLARPLHPGPIWDQPQASQQFPDDIFNPGSRPPAQPEPTASAEGAQ